MDLAPSDWWKTYFHGATNDVFRSVMAPRAAADAERIERVLGLASASTILDVPCGHGRIAIELAAHGHVVTGIDLAAEEIARAKRTAGERDVAVDFRVGDMRFDVPSAAFDATVCFGHSFGYFDDETNAAFLRAARDSLRAGGSFAMETHFCLESYLPKIAERARPLWMKSGDVYLLQKETFDPESGRLAIEQTYLTPGSGKVENARLSCRVYSCRELVALMRSAGFGEVRALDIDGGAPFSVGGSLLLVGTRMV
jgi:SAM-dependent methyltransferase